MRAARHRSSFSRQGDRSVSETLDSLDAALSEKVTEPECCNRWSLFRKLNGCKVCENEQCSVKSNRCRFDLRHQRHVAASTLLTTDCCIFYIMTYRYASYTDFDSAQFAAQSFSVAGPSQLHQVSMQRITAEFHCLSSQFL